MFGLRKMTWVLIAWSAGILAWIIQVAVHNHRVMQRCEAQGVLSAHTCQAIVNAGTGIDTLGILLVGFVGFVFFSLIWLMSRPARRMCPVCGWEMRKGATVCLHCETDFMLDARHLHPVA